MPKNSKFLTLPTVQAAPEYGKHAQHRRNYFRLDSHYADGMLG
jgi:hypothetical protein